VKQGQQSSHLEDVGERDGQAEVEHQAEDARVDIPYGPPDQRAAV
jgi:hypothetical protein